MMIKAVIFDVDGVLLDSFEANLKFFQNLMVKTGYQPPTREEYRPLFHLTMYDAIAVLTKNASPDEVQRIWEIGKGRDVPYNLSLLAMPADADNVINELSRQYLLGIVTSRVRESTWEAPGLAKLQPYFQAAVSYQDTANHKPHPEPLLLAAQKLNVKPEETVYIGDVENDVIAARAAGMKVIIYSKNQFDAADACTASFKELPRLIESL